MIVQFSMGDESLQKIYNVRRTKQAECMAFSVAGLGDYTCDSSYFVRRKGMEQCLILYTLEGEGIVKYNNSEYTVGPGQVMVLDCRKYHCYATKEERWHFLWIHYRGKCAYDYEELLNGNGADPFGIHERCGFREYFYKIVSHMEHFSPYSELEISLVIQRLLTDLIRIKKTERFFYKYGGYESQMEKSLSYIHERLGESISVEELAKESGMSVYYFIKVFHAYTGQTPYDYFMDLRLQKARMLLTETDETVESVAMSVGFTESKNFIACFKKRIGITPLQFRKQSLGL